MSDVIDFNEELNPDDLDSDFYEGMVAEMNDDYEDSLESKVDSLLLEDEDCIG